ncbi:MAG: hypothetical protein ACOYY2_02990 [Actinomycetota bacterium]
MSARRPFRLFGVEVVNAPPEENTVLEVMVITKHYAPGNTDATYSLHCSRGWGLAEKIGILDIFHDSALATVNKDDYR